MALSATMIFEVRQDGSDTTCSGGFRGGANMAAPTAPTATATAGGAVSAATYYVVVTINDGNGESQKSAERSVTTAGGNLTITVTDPTPAVGQTYLVYVATATGGPYWQNSATATAHGTNVTITATPPTSGVQAPGTDYSQSTTAQLHIDNAIQTATTPGANSNTLTFTGPYIPTAADVGNTYQATGGTNINVGTYEIIAFTATTWTLTGAQNLTTAGGAGAALTGYMGGALANLLTAITASVSGNYIYMKYNATPYTIGSTATLKGSMTGYDTTRTRNNLDANRPTLNCSANSISPVVKNAVTSSTIRNLIVAANGKTGIVAFGDSVAGTDFFNCKASAVVTGFSASNGNERYMLCQAASCTTTGFSSAANSAEFDSCVASATTGHGFTLSGGQMQTLINCAAVNSTSSGNGFHIGSNRAALKNCTAYGNAANGFNIVSSGPTAALTNCLAVSNTTFGFNDSGTSVQADWLENCAAFGNGSGDYSGYLQGRLLNFLSLSAAPFTNAAGLDFSLNNTAGGGSACKAAGIPGSTTGLALPGLATNSYPDIGAVQSATLVTGAGPLPIGQTTGVF